MSTWVVATVICGGLVLSGSPTAYAEENIDKPTLINMLTSSMNSVIENAKKAPYSDSTHVVIPSATPEIDKPLLEYVDYSDPNTSWKSVKTWNASRVETRIVGRTIKKRPPRCATQKDASAPWVPCSERPLINGETHASKAARAQLAADIYTITPSPMVWATVQRDGDNTVYTMFSALPGDVSHGYDVRNTLYSWTFTPASVVFHQETWDLGQGNTDTLTHFGTRGGMWRTIAPVARQSVRVPEPN